MANPEDSLRALRREQKKELETIVRGSTDASSPQLLPIDTRREKFFYAKHPTMVYCALPNGPSVRIILHDTGIDSNDVEAHPENYGVMINKPYWKLPIETERAVGTGDLVKIVNPPEKDTGNLNPTRGLHLLGSPSNSGTVKEISIGDATLRMGENGEIQLESGGNLMVSFTDGKQVQRIPINKTTFPWADKASILAKDLLSSILPRAFIPPLNFPNYIPDLSAFYMVASLGEELGLVLELTKKTDDVA